MRSPKVKRPWRAPTEVDQPSKGNSIARQGRELALAIPLPGEIMKTALVAVTLVTAAHLAVGMVQTTAQAIKAHHARIASIEAAAR
jgi:hypothetical protein